MMSLLPMNQFFMGTGSSGMAQSITMFSSPFAFFYFVAFLPLVVAAFDSCLALPFAFVSLVAGCFADLSCVCYRTA